MNSFDLVLTRLETVTKWGVKLYLCGKLASPEAVAKCIVRESETYMPDFVYDDDGNLDEVRYDRVSNTH